MVYLAKVNSYKMSRNILSQVCKEYSTAYSKLNLFPTCARVLFKSILLTSLMSIPVNAESVDNDKQQHFIAETVICGTTMMYTESWWQTMLVGLSIGVLKESYDSTQEGNKFDKNDMAANLLGCVAGISYGATVLHFHYESETDTTTIGVKGKF